MIPNAFVTGCDHKTEWMLPWFLRNFRKYNNYPIYFADFGVSKSMRKWVEESEEFEDIIEFEDTSHKKWYLKPAALMKTPAKNKVWLDTDCEVRAGLNSIFNYIEVGKLAVVEDTPWSRRRGETWHNSGVVGVHNSPKVLDEWQFRCKNNAVDGNPLYGDQDILHEMLSDPLTRCIHINDLPNKFNFLRLQILDGEDPKFAYIIHWTGQKGKDEIRRQMNDN